MLKSLRFRLPALFLAGIALSGLVTSLIALRLFQDYTRTASLNELRREARGLAQLYAESAVRAVDEEKAAPAFAAAKLEAATGDRLFYVGDVAVAGRGQRPDARHAQGRRRRSLDDRIVTFEFKPPGERRTFLAAAHPIRPGGADRVRLPDRREAEGRAARRLGDPALAARARVPLLARGRRRARLLPHARITGPVLALSDAADEVSGATTTSRCRACPAAARSATSPTASAR